MASWSQMAVTSFPTASWTVKGLGHADPTVRPTFGASRMPMTTWFARAMVRVAIRGMWRTWVQCVAPGNKLAISNRSISDQTEWIKMFQKVWSEPHAWMTCVVIRPMPVDGQKSRLWEDWHAAVILHVVGGSKHRSPATYSAPPTPEQRTATTPTPAQFIPPGAMAIPAPMGSLPSPSTTKWMAWSWAQRPTVFFAHLLDWATAEGLTGASARKRNSLFRHQVQGPKSCVTVLVKKLVGRPRSKFPDQTPAWNSAVAKETPLAPHAEGFKWTSPMVSRAERAIALEILLFAVGLQIQSLAHTMLSRILADLIFVLEHKVVAMPRRQTVATVLAHPC